MATKKSVTHRESETFEWARFETAKKTALKGRSTEDVGLVHQVRRGQRDRPPNHTLIVSMTDGHGPTEDNEAIARYANDVAGCLQHEAIRGIAHDRPDVTEIWGRAVTKLEQQQAETKYPLKRGGAVGALLIADVNGIRFAWAGDVSLWCVTPERIWRLNHDHNLDRAEERARVEQKIKGNPGFVIDETRKRVSRWSGAKPVTIRPTRTIGDAAWQPVLISDPEMVTIDRKNIDRKAIYVVATDGANGVLPGALLDTQTNGFGVRGVTNFFRQYAKGGSFHDDTMVVAFRYKSRY